MTTIEMKNEITRMKNTLDKLDKTIDTVLDLQGFEYSSQGWETKANDYNEWVEAVMEFEDECDEIGINFSRFEMAQTQFNILVDYAKVDILKTICKVY